MNARSKIKKKSVITMLETETQKLIPERRLINPVIHPLGVSALGIVKSSINIDV